MSRGLFMTALATIALAITAGTAQAASPTQPNAEATAATAVGTLETYIAVNKVVVRGKKLVALGHVIGRFTSAEGTEVVRQPFATPVRRISKGSRTMQSTQRTARICDILNLNLAPLRLELLGLIVELDRVVLTIKADSNGGLLGSLLCGLAGRSGLLGLPTQQDARNLTKALRRSGLASGPLSSTQLAAPAQLPPVPEGICTVLDLVLGPLDLNLLGLMVHLDRVQLRITADPEGGLLGSLLCGLAGGVPPIPGTQPQG